LKHYIENQKYLNETGDMHMEKISHLSMVQYICRKWHLWGSC